MLKRLKENFVLRGWFRLPYGILDTNTGKTTFLDAGIFQAASFCNGEVDLNLPVVLPSHAHRGDTAGGIITYDDGAVSFCGQVGN